MWPFLEHQCELHLCPLICVYHVKQQQCFHCLSAATQSKSLSQENRTFCHQSSDPLSEHTGSSTRPPGGQGEEVRRRLDADNTADSRMQHHKDTSYTRNNTDQLMSTQPMLDQFLSLPSLSVHTESICSEAQTLKGLTCRRPHLTNSTSPEEPLTAALCWSYFWL